MFQWLLFSFKILATYKSYVRNKDHPKGLIVEAYIVNESLTFCSQYFFEIETKFNQPD